MRKTKERKNGYLSSLVPKIENSHVFSDIKWSVEPQEQANTHAFSLAAAQAGPQRMELTLISLTLW